MRCNTIRSIISPMPCRECENLRSLNEQRAQMHQGFVSEYRAALESSNTGRIKLLESALAGSKKLCEVGKEHLSIHEASHSLALSVTA